MIILIFIMTGIVNMITILMIVMDEDEDEDEDDEDDDDDDDDGLVNEDGCNGFTVSKF